MQMAKVTPEREFTGMMLKSKEPGVKQGIDVQF